MLIRRCTSCGIEKVQEDFTKRNDRKSGYHSYCNSCNAQKHTTSYYRLRRAMLDLLGAACVKCGYNKDERGLCLDHIKGGGTKERRILGQWKMMKRVFEFPEEYQILCGTCNQIKHYEQDIRKTY